MNCRQFRKQVAELFDVDPSLEHQGPLMAHAETCPQCARELDEMEKTLEALQPSQRVAASAGFKETVMNRITKLSNENVQTPLRAAPRPFWKPALSVGLVVALVIAAVVAFSIRSSAPVYALEQTIEANRSVRSIHMKMTPPAFGSVGEIWAQFDENGELEHLRMNFPDTEDGPKDVVWENGKAQVWFKAKGSTVVVVEENLLERIGTRFGFFDPRLIVEGLYRKAADKDVDIEVEESATAGAPITITATVKGVPDRRDVYTVDPATKLLLKLDVHRLKGSAFKLEGSTQYLEYNEPIDPSVFTLDVPQNTMHVDQTTQEIGLVQGDMSNEEVAVEVVRQFFEAMIAKNYARAGQLMEGMLGAKLEELYSRVRFIRIISIGEPTPYEKNRSLKVPCKIEVESDGEIRVAEPRGPFVRQVYNQPERWSICGGI